MSRHNRTPRTGVLFVGVIILAILSVLAAACGQTYTHRRGAVIVHDLNGAFELGMSTDGISGMTFMVAESDFGDYVRIIYVGVCGIGGGLSETASPWLANKTVSMTCHEGGPGPDGDMAFGMEQAQEACDSIKYCSVWLIGYQPCQPQPSCEDRMLSTAQAVIESGGHVLGGIVSKDDASPANYEVLLDIEGFRQLVGQP